MRGAHQVAGAAAVLALICALAPAAALAETASLPDIEDEVMCPICGTTLELSDSPQANRERELIRRLIAEGGSKEEIKDALVAEYGEDVLAEPEADGFDLMAWLVPLLGFALTVLGLWIGFRGRRRRKVSADSPPAPTPSEQRRLERDLSASDR